MTALIPVTRTRIISPRRRGEILTRKRLLDMLSELIEKRLIIIAAPAGYGKTSLLIDFSNHIEFPVCWYSITDLDQDLSRFLTYFISCIQYRFPEFGQASLTALQSASPDKIDLDHLATVIVNDAYENIAEHFIVVLDDYHLVNGCPPIEQFISRFIQNVDENCHLIISSRTLLTLPDFPLMVARSQVSGLSFEELAFQSEEIQSLFQQNFQTTISNKISQDWLNQTEGWITGLLLSTQMLHKHIPDQTRLIQASGVGLNKYLEEILSQLPPHLQRFLLRTSLLEEFNADLCEEIIGKALGLHHQNWQEMMDSILQNNLFIIPINDDGIWLRYHHLFHDFLKQKLEQTAPEEVVLIRHKLAEYFAEKQDWERAYSYLETFQGTEEIADLIELAGPDMISRGQIHTLEIWLENLPPEIRIARPAMLSLQGGIAAHNGETQKSIHLLSQSIDAMGSDKYSLHYARALVRRASVFHILGNYISALEDADNVIRISNLDPIMMELRAEAFRTKGLCLYQQGLVKDALTWMNQSIEIYQLLGKKENEAILLTETCVLQQSVGNFIGAEQDCLKALEYWQGTEINSWQANALANLGFLQHMKGDYISAAETFEKVLDYAKNATSPRLEAYILTSIGDLYQDLQAVNEAVKAYRQAYITAQRIGDQALLIYLDLAEAGLARTQKRYKQAEERLSTAWEMAQKSASSFDQSLCYLEVGCLSNAQRNNEKAVRNLEEAVACLEKEDHNLEAAKAHLQLSIAYSNSKFPDKITDHFTRALSLTQKYPQALIAYALWIKDDLKKIEKFPSVKPILTNFLKKVERFENQLPELRRHIRQQSTQIPFAPPKISIRSLGANQVFVNDELISIAKWQTQTARDLFFILLAHPEGLTKEAIGLMFWPDASYEDFKSRFKNTIYRIRHAIGKEAVLLENELYRFNHALDYENDVESFSREIKLAKYASEPSVAIQHYINSLSYYRGPYLPDREEDWVLAERTRLADLHINALLELARLKFSDAEYNEALKYTQIAIDIDPCLETAHRLAMQIHAALGNRADIERQYQRCKQAMAEEVNALPSQQTQLLHQNLMK